jgi:hypothetical protein
MDEKESRRSQYKRSKNSKKIECKKTRKKMSKLHLQSMDIFETPEQCDWALKLIEDVLVLLKLLKGSNGTIDYSFAAVTFIKLRTSKPLIQSAFAVQFSEYCLKIFTSEDAHELQSIDFDALLAGADSVIGKYDKVKDSKIFIKLQKCILYALSFSIFEKLGITFNTFNYTTLEAEYVRRKHSSKADALRTILDTLLFILKKGRAIMVYGNVDVIFHSSENYEKWANNVAKIKKQSQMLTHPDISGVNEADFLAY